MTTDALAPAAEAVFGRVVSSTAFEETVDRLGNAIKLGLLAPGARLPAERELCGQLGISRSTLRQALTALAQSGHVRATRGRGGGTFVCADPPRAQRPSVELLSGWREVCDRRLAVELGIAALAADRAQASAIATLEGLVEQLGEVLDRFPRYREVDVRLHMGLAEAADSPALLRSAAETQAEMTDLISCIPHPPEVLASSNAQHRRLISAIRDRDPGRSVRIMHEHLQGTEHVLAGLSGKFWIAGLD